MKEIKATNECRHEIGYKLMKPIVSWNYKRKAIILQLPYIDNVK